MLLSQSFHKHTPSRDSLNHSSKESCSSKSTQHTSFQQTPMSISSLSSSSSPSEASTPPDLKQTCNLEPCESGAFKNDASAFQIEQLFVKSEGPNDTPPSSDSCSGALYHEISSNGSALKNGNGSYAGFNQNGSYNKFYEHTPSSFDSQTSNNLLSSSASFHRSNSQELTSSSETILLQHSTSTSSRKSYDNISDKELRKKLKNRESAQAARDRKKAKMLSLERQVSELHERYRLVESENQELRVRIQRMEASACWMIDKQDTNGVPSDSSGVFSFPFGPPVHGSGPSDMGVFGRVGQYSNGLCSFGEYSQPPQSVPVPEPVEEGNQNFTQMTLDGATDFHSSPYGTTMWGGENLGSLHNSQHQGNFNVGEQSGYNESSSMIG